MSALVNKTKKIMLEGSCVINEKKIKTFRAVIDCDDNFKMRRSHSEVDEAACKEYRKEVREAEAEFDDYAYDEQEKLAAAK